MLAAETSADPHPCPPCNRLLDECQSEAQALGHNYIGTEHLLLVLLKDTEGTAAKVLNHLEINRERVREEVLEAITDPTPRDDIDKMKPKLVTAGNVWQKSKDEVCGPKCCVAPHPV